MHGMKNRVLKPNFIRAWREYRGLSLDRLVDRMSSDLTSEQFITKTSLSRIERSLQPYSQPLLEAIAEALQCQPADLIMRNPSDTEAPWSIWQKLGTAERNQVIEIMHTFRKTGTG